MVEKDKDFEQFWDRCIAQIKHGLVYGPHNRAMVIIPDDKVDFMEEVVQRLKDMNYQVVYPAAPTFFPPTKWLDVFSQKWAVDSIMVWAPEKLTSLYMPTEIREQATKRFKGQEIVGVTYLYCNHEAACLVESVLAENTLALFQKWNGEVVELERPNFDTYKFGEREFKRVKVGSTEKCIVEIYNEIDKSKD